VRQARLDHRFVEFIPEEMQPGVLYVSLPFTTVAHLCCCGCGSKVVTPLSPHDWRLTFNGATVSLAPSVGNWSYPCRSHYWIHDGTVRWARQWTPGQVQAARTRNSRPQQDLPDVREPATTRLLPRILRRLRHHRAPKT
jgi:hypothetical protein